MLELIIVVLGVILDRVTKVWAVTLKGQAGITIINGFFGFEYLENRGAAFGIFQEKKIFLVGFTSIVLIALIVFLIKERKNSRLMSVSLSLIISGAIGNLYDRVFSGYVTDFILVHYKDIYYFPTFNVADILVVVGTGLLMILLIKEMIEEKKGLDEKNV
ncbi:signal peptidase II [Oceanirhabdus seepicola]|uniref:Lipoprotein signal peptidase n=1 Tax=Oceanirhabdus seepicola TaxID=2828781 RepID=A0A9J6P822_9CLOT|nr:signal peptidase II [Oceanirhabdus seepicola]MCM1992723.1 signal peptidase II [Oceanirhabdus seepicola]